MKKYCLFCLVLAIAALSCKREEVDNGEQVKPGAEGVTITVELPSGENTGFDFEGGKLKDYWVQGDQLLVTYVQDGKEVQEIFTYSSTESKPSGEFTCPDSKLTPETVYSVQHPVKPDWSLQTGAVEDMPDYLVATDVKGPVNKATLERKVTFLRIVVAAGIAQGQGRYSQATLNKVWGGCTLCSAPGQAGAITIKPKEMIDVSKGFDFFVTAMFDGATTAPGQPDFFFDGETSLQPGALFRVYFSNGVNGISLDGQCFDPVGPYHKMDWIPAKDYQPDYWYSITNREVTYDYDIWPVIGPR